MFRLLDFIHCLNSIENTLWKQEGYLFLSSSETKGKYLIGWVPPQPLTDNSSSYRTQTTMYLPTLSCENGYRSSFPKCGQLGMLNGVQNAENKYLYHNPEWIAQSGLGTFNFLVWPVRRADLTTFMCRMSWNLGTSTSWNPQGLSSPVMGLLYLYHNPSGRTMALGLTQPPTEMSTRNIPWG
jgi:hypothetical protein